MLFVLLLISLVSHTLSTDPVISFPIHGQPPLEFYETQDVCEVLHNYCSSLPFVAPNSCLSQIHIELIRQFTRAWESIVSQLVVGPEFFVDCEPLGIDPDKVALFNSQFIPHYVPPDHFTTRNSTQVVDQLLSLLKRAMKRDTQVGVNRTYRGHRL